jgi:hypothetical protein
MAALIASPEKVNITQARIIAKDRATRSRKLKVSAQIKSDNAVMAMPASKIWFSVAKTLSKKHLHLIFQ